MIQPIFRGTAFPTLWLMRDPYTSAEPGITLQTIPSLSTFVESGPKSDDSPTGETLLDFLQLWKVLSTYDGDLRDPLWWTQERPVAMRVVRGHLGIPLPSMLGPKTLCAVADRT